MLFLLVHVMGNGAEIVKELAEQVPALIALHHFLAQEMVAQSLDGFLQQNFLTVHRDITEPFVFRCSGAIGGIRSGRKPALIDSAAMRSQGIQIARIKF